MVAGGAEAAITGLTVAAFDNMKALSRRNDAPEQASRPFDSGRDGFVLGDGAGVVVLESLEHARARGATILGEIIGYGMSGDAHHITSPPDDGNGAARAMNAASRTVSGPCPGRLHQRPWHLDPPGGCCRDPRGQGGVRRSGQEAGFRLHKVDDRAFARRGGRPGVHRFPVRRADGQDSSHDQPGDARSRAAISIPRPTRWSSADVAVALSNSFGFGGHNVTLAVRRFTD